MSDSVALSILATISKDGPSREKSLRAIGSALKAAHYYAKEGDVNVSIVKPLGQLATAISEARRIYRQCKYIETVSVLLKTFQKPASFQDTCTLGRYLSLTFHYLFDQIVFLREHGLLQKQIDKERLADLKKKTSLAWWLSLCFNLCALSYSYLRLCDRNKKLEERLHLCNASEQPKLREKVQRYKAVRLRLQLSILKDLFDYPCAMEGTLKRGSLHNGQVGLCATISSLIGLYLVYPNSH